MLLGGGFFAWNTFMAPAVPPPPPTKQKTATPTAATPKGTAPAPTAATPPATPSETLNNLAHAPANAVNKAKDAVNARAASGQSSVDPVTDPAAKSAAAQPAATASTGSTGVASLSPGVSATTALDAVPDASAAFRSFVANAKIGGVVAARAGRPPVAIINGRLARAGDLVEANLGIIFFSVDDEKNQVIFKDKAGATVARRF